MDIARCILVYCRVLRSERNVGNLVVGQALIEPRLDTVPRGSPFGTATEMYSGPRQGD